MSDGPDPVIDLERYRVELDAFAEADAADPPPERPVLFVGSSSVVLWKASEAFPDYPVVNRGFGGSTLLEVNHHFDRVVARYRPSVVVLYCDNDIFTDTDAAGYAARFTEFLDRVESELPGTRVIALSIKIPLTEGRKSGVHDEIRAANVALEEIVAGRPRVRLLDATTPLQRDGLPRDDVFSDGHHLNERGYELWNALLAQPLAEEHAATAIGTRP